MAMLRSRQILLGMVLAAVTVCTAQMLRSQTLVWIDPANPYASYLEAAVQKKHTPVTFTTRKEQAADIATLSAVAEAASAAWGKSGGAVTPGAASLSLSVASVSSGLVVFAYTCEKPQKHGVQKVAECLAEHWRDHLKKARR